MNTKLIKLWCLLPMLCAGLFLAWPASGQSVYSVNALGYADFNLAAGTNYITYPFRRADQTVARLFPSLPNGASLQIWQPFLLDFGDTNLYSTASGWSFPNQTLALPQGVLLWMPSPA